MTAKHTPGPWAVVETKDPKIVSIWHIEVGVDQISFFPYKRIWSECQIYSGLVIDDQKMANARLMAAAPEMAAALQRAAHVLAELPDQPEAVKALRSQIVAAIILATPEHYGVHA